MKTLVGAAEPDDSDRQALLGRIARLMEQVRVGRRMIEEQDRIIRACLREIAEVGITEMRRYNRDEEDMAIVDAAERKWHCPSCPYPGNWPPGCAACNGLGVRKHG